MACGVVLQLDKPQQRLCWASRYCAESSKVAWKDRSKVRLAKVFQWGNVHPVA
jgi:hypothetical protein